MQLTTSQSRVTAVLGPTNTGKTYLALDRMLGHDSGMIGFPLRLLARENYDRAAAIKGARNVALITGEEKIVPPYARWFFCTVEAMPMDKRLAFVGIDEVQLAADPDRGHVFTDRVLHARGTEETMFMGSDTARPRLRQLVDGIEFTARPRLSKLSYAGVKKIHRLPPRSAVVGFTAADVYAIAELIRRQRGGAAIVMGALSPRTRNAQVALYQNGDVDYLVATDAIGMGLNMDIDNVAFAGLTKFDGRVSRALRPDELAQIAGRAGRHMNDGTFGTTHEAGTLEPEVVARIEEHRFDRLRALYWRNRDLDYASVAALQASLAAEPAEPGLIRVQTAADTRALDDLARDAEVAARAATPDDVRLLWDVCQIPDFQKTMSDSHVNLLRQVFGHLAGEGRLPADWVAGNVARIDRVDGDIDTLLGRIARVRIWTYISHRADWLDDAAHWQERTRAVEDRLSDALHESLTQRFVDQRTASLVKRLADRAPLTARVEEDGEVVVEGHAVGRLEGFAFVPDAAPGSPAGRAVTNAAMKALESVVARRVDALAKAGGEGLALADDGGIEWQGARIARLKAGRTALAPEVALVRSDLLDAAARTRVSAVLRDWLAGEIKARLGPLTGVRTDDVGGALRGLLFRLSENFGNLDRRAAAEALDKLSADDRIELKKLGVRFGRETVYLPTLLKPAPSRLAAVLWAVHAGLDTVPDLPPAGRTSIPAPTDAPRGFLEAAGYRVLGRLALRLDIVERLLGLAWKDGPKGTQLTPEMLNLAGCSEDEMAGVLGGLGFKRRKNGEDVLFAPPKPARPQGSRARKGQGKGQGQGQGKGKGKSKAKAKTKTAADDSPFAKLKEILPAS